MCEEGKRNDLKFSAFYNDANGNAINFTCCSKGWYESFDSSISLLTPSGKEGWEEGGSERLL